MLQPRLLATEYNWLQRKLPGQLGSSLQHQTSTQLNPMLLPRLCNNLTARYSQILLRTHSASHNRTATRHPMCPMPCQIQLNDMHHQRIRLHTKHHHSPPMHLAMLLLHHINRRLQTLPLHNLHNLHQKLVHQTHRELWMVQIGMICRKTLHQSHLLVVRLQPLPLHR